MSATAEVQKALELQGLPGATAGELRRLYRSAEWEDLTGGLHDPDTAVRDCADLVASWRRERNLPAGRSAEASRIRARSLAFYAAASEWDEVVAFRSTVLGGHLVALDDLRDWIVQRLPPLSQRHGLPNLKVPFEDMRRVHVVPDTDLDRLRTLAEHLADWFGWGVDQAVAFVVTDAVPAVSGVRSEYPQVSSDRSAPAQRVVTLTVSPDVPPAVVAARYAEAQRELVGHAYKSPSQQSFDLVSEWVLRGRRSFRELARSFSRIQDTLVTRNAAQMTVRRTWRAVTGSDCPGPGPSAQ